MKLSVIIKAGLAGVLALVASIVFSAANATTINVTRCVASVNKTMSDGTTVTFWEFGTSGMMCTGAMPGTAIEVGVYPTGSGMSDTLNLTLNVGMMTPQEASPYNGHTIHMHGADVNTANDGVPETSSTCTGNCTYTWTPTSEMVGSDIYHCHVHTVKHLEMGMYGALIARPKNTSGTFLNQLTQNTTTAFDYVQNYVFSTVDPAYHTATGDSTVFADYNPKYFLISGNEGKTTSSPAVTLSAAVNKKVALRLIGVHSVNGTFTVKDSSGNSQTFTVYTQDGRELSAPQTATSLDISPGQRYDIVFTTPSASGTWYPQIAYKSLRDGSTYTNGTVYGKVTF